MDISILNTCFQWVGDDHPEISKAMGSLCDDYESTNYDNMSNIVDTYNKAVVDLLSKAKTRNTALKRLNKHPSRKMLKHILMQVYNKAISDPNELNHYEPFTPEVSSSFKCSAVCPNGSPKGDLGPLGDLLAQMGPL